MARARNIKPGFFINEQLAQVSAYARLLYIGLWCVADREGRLEDRPMRIKAEIFPYDQVDVDALLGELSRQGLIIRYSVGDASCIWIPKFLLHQRPHQNEAESLIPALTDIAPRYEVLGTKVAST